MNRIAKIYHSISINWCEFLPVLFNVLTIIVGFTSKSYRITILFSLISILSLIYYIKYITTKLTTLEILARENRPGTIRLLLLYEYLKKESLENPIFRPSKLKIETASYSYRIFPCTNFLENIPLENNLHCHYTFKLNKPIAKKIRFDILIAQPRGSKLNHISYKDSTNNTQKKSNLTQVVNQGDQHENHIDGLWTGMIEIEAGAKNFEVEYTLNNVYRNYHTGAILICPFIYAEEVKNLIFHLYFDSNTKTHPSSVEVQMFPYDGKRTNYEKTTNLSYSEDSLHWNGSIIGKDCRSNAAYIMHIKSN